jgi:hypothetical protein
VEVRWDEAKNLANQQKHGVTFEQARELFTSGRDYLEIFDDAHSDAEERFIAIGPISGGDRPHRLDRAGRNDVSHHQRSLGH